MRHLPQAHLEDLDLVLEGWRLQQALDFVRVRELLGTLSMDRLLRTPELASLLLHAHIHLQDYARAEQMLEQMRPSFSVRPNDTLHRRFVNAEAGLYCRRGQLAESDALSHTLLEMAYAAGDIELVLNANSMLGIAAIDRGDFVYALRMLQRCLALPDEVREDWMPVVHHNLAVAYRELEFTAEAERYFEASERGTTAEWVSAHNAVDRAVLLYRTGDDPAAAWALAAHGLAIFERLGMLPGIAESRLALAQIMGSRGDVAHARALVNRALAELPPGHILLSAQLHEELAALDVMEGRPGTDARAAAEAFYGQLAAGPRLQRMRERLEHLGTGRPS